MESLETLRRRIRSVEDLASIVGTMKAMAAVKIRRFEGAVEALAEYQETIEIGFSILMRSPEAPGLEEVESRLPAAVILGTDQGMCGAFNEQVAEFALERVRAHLPAATSWSVLGLGARLAERLEGTALAPAQVLPLPSALEGVTPLVHEVLLRIDAWQRQGRFDRLSIIHQRRRRGAHAVPRERQLLPLPARWLRHLGERPWESRSLPAFTMDYRRLLPSLTAIR